MDRGAREHLRIILSVALALVPQPIRRNWAERVISKSQPAKAEIVERLIGYIDQQFDVEKKPEVPTGPAMGSRERQRE